MMELSKENEERLKKVALRATALVVGGAVVKYLWDNGMPQAFVFHNKDSGNMFMGLYEEQELVSQVTGSVKDREGDPTVVVDGQELDERTISRYEQVFDRPAPTEI